MGELIYLKELSESEDKGNKDLVAALVAGHVLDTLKNSEYFTYRDFNDGIYEFEVNDPDDQTGSDIKLFFNCKNMLDSMIIVFVNNMLLPFPRKFKSKLSEFIIFDEYLVLTEFKILNQIKLFINISVYDS